MRLGFLAPLLGGLLLAACGSRSPRIAAQSGVSGQEVPLPGGSGATFFVDPNANGQAVSFQIVELLFGRLVDVHDIDGLGATRELPIFEDFLVELDLLGSSAYRLEANPLTGRERLVILANRSTDPTSFGTLLSNATDGLVSVVQRNDNGLDSGPFSSIPRNCSISIQFNDMLDDSAAAIAALSDNVKLLVGNLPSQPFFARMFFDPNHGALLSGEFHSTRVIVDLAVSEAEAAESGGALMANPIGLPAGDTTSSPNVSIRIPTRTVAAGQPTIQTTLLTSVSGRQLDFSSAGTVSPNATLDVVRAFRPANFTHANNGFMPDNVDPEILGSWDLTVGAATNMGGGALGFDFLLDLQFDTICQSTMEIGDLLELGSNMLLVTAPATPDGSGNIVGLEARSLSAVADPNTFVGVGAFVSPLDPALTGIDGCWVTFSGSPSTPTSGISTTANLNIRFSEPMDPDSVTLLDNILLVRGNSSVQPSARNRVAGSFMPDIDLEQFTMVHPLPFGHQAGMADVFTLRMHVNDVGFTGTRTIALPTDLAGNSILNPLPVTQFTINASDAAASNASIIFRFDRELRSNDTNEPSGINEVRDPTSTSSFNFRGDFSGDFTPDASRGSISPREVDFRSFIIDGMQPSVAAMLFNPIFVPPFTAPLTGVPEPLIRLGAKTQTLWRHFDMGMRTNESSSLDLDVVGLNWVPINGVVNRDFYPSFEIKLGTSARMPEELFNATSVTLNDPESGLNPSATFQSSVMGGATRLFTVHERSKGYSIRTIDRFNAATGTPMVPFPMNQALAPGESMQTYTWRDSSNADTSTQVIATPTPADVAFYGIGVTPGSSAANDNVGTIHAESEAKQAAVMPLLMEFNCFTSSNAIGSNRFSVGLLAPGVDGTFKPYSRLFTSGGINSLGFPVPVNPDAAIIPAGGFNPLNGGSATPGGDNVYYLGQLDTVFRVTRLVSHWIDLIGASFTGVVSMSAPILEPSADKQPLGTSILLSYRTATGFTGNTIRAFDPAFHGPNGDPILQVASGTTHSINFQAMNMTNNTVNGRVWTNDITEVKSRYMQVRISFVNNIDSGTSPTLSALAFPYGF